MSTRRHDCRFGNIRIPLSPRSVYTPLPHSQLIPKTVFGAPLRVKDFPDGVQLINDVLAVISTRKRSVRNIRLYSG